MKLRRLQEKDAPHMLEWMHDEELVRHMHRDFSAMKLENCRNFIQHSVESGTDVHFAVADENDEYLGTVSLKDIRDRHAEFGIVVRRKAMGHGIAAAGMKEILRYGFEQLSLDFVFWCVDRRNRRALSFYDKNKYLRTEYAEIGVDAQYGNEEISRFIWYCHRRQKTVL